MNASDLPKTSERRRGPFRLGDLEVRPDSGEVVGPRGTVRLRPLLVEILLRLAVDPGAVVRRETLLEEVWPRRMVNDEVLSRAIAELRTAIGDDARAARYVETLPKIGYRLVAPVSGVEAGDRNQETGTRSQKDQRPAPWRLSPGAWLLPALAITVVLAVAGLMLWSPWRSPASADLAPRLAAARVFTSDPGMELGPRFSPDGTQVAFALASGATSRIVVQSIDASTRRLVGDGHDVRVWPVFFPDGRRIAYWRRAAGTCSIVEHDLASGAERALLDCSLSPRARFDLSRDGTRIVFSGQAHRDQPAGLWLLDLGGAAPVQLTAPQAGAGDDLMPRFSPDGARIAFFRGNESRRQAWVVEVGGGTARAAGAQDGLAYGVAWLDSKGPLLVAADWLGFRALNVLDLETGTATLAGARGARSPDLGPGGRIVWEHAEYSANLWLARDGGEPAVQWRSTRYSGQAEFSPDGRQVAFASNRDGTDAIYVAALDGTPRRIAFGEAWRYSRPHWSADGTAVYATRVSVGRRGHDVQEAVRIPVSGAAAEALALGASVVDARESRDGRWLIWAVPSGNALALWRAPRAQPSASQRLPLPPVSHFHANAQWLVFAQPQLARLTACRLETLACAPLGVELEADALYHWALGPGSLYVRVREGGKVAVAVHDLATGARTATLPLAPSGAGTSIAVTPDERAVLIAREEGPTVDLMLAR